MALTVRAIVVSWNSAALLPRCIEHLRATEGPHRVALVVVDNASSDGTVEWAESQPDVQVIRSGANRGFGAAVNLALRDLDGVDAVALVNPDAFVDPGWLVPLVDALATGDDVGAACPKILFEEPDAAGRTVINNVGNLVGPTWELHDRGYGEPDAGQYDRPEDVWGWCGGGVLLPRRYLDDVGLFEERLFLYAEDAELSWRGLHRGWRYRYVPTSVVRHRHRASSGGTRTPLLDYLNRRNRLVVVSRHAGARGAATAWVRALGGIPVATVAELAAAVRRRRRPDLRAPARRVRAAVDAARILAGGDPGLPASVAP